MSNTFFSCFRNKSAAFDGMYNFIAWDIFHEYMMAFMKFRSSSGVKETNKIEKKFMKPFVTFRTVFILLAKFLLHWRGNGMKLCARLNQVGRKQNCITIILESFFFLRDNYFKLNKDIAWVPRIKSTLA